MNMNSPRPARRSSTRALITLKLAIVLAVIAIGGGLLAYEWEHAHSGKTHAASAHHHSHGDANSAGAH
jgi:hypothetical protein